VSESHAQAPALAHHFESYEQQKETSFLGMWLFLAQEIMFFGGMFVTYVVYRTTYPLAFEAGSHELPIHWGFANTLVLLVSSFTMVVAVNGAQTGKPKRLFAGLVGTIVFGLVFLSVKYVEYSIKWDHHLVPGLNWAWDGPDGAQIYFSLYFAMTGMHALHMVVGIGIMLFMLRPALRGKWTPENYNFVEGFGLYWHFVDIVWIFLFPYLYLIR